MTHRGVINPDAISDTAEKKKDNENIKNEKSLDK